MFDVHTTEGVMMARDATTLPLLTPAAALRKAAGLSAADLAARLGCSRANVFQTERRAAGVALSTLATWADACGVELTIEARPKCLPQESTGASKTVLALLVRLT